MAIFAAWSLLPTRLTAEGMPSRVVIQRNEMSYQVPISGRFTATAAFADPLEWERLCKMLLRKTGAE